MTKPILDELFWKERLEDAEAKGERHRAVFICTLSKWKAIEEAHRVILKDLIKPKDSIIDVGCGWGRLLDLLPEDWNGDYSGIDISPDFLEIARKERDYAHWFVQGDILELPVVMSIEREWAIATSIMPMIIRELGGDAWAIRQDAILKSAKKLLLLEYDETDPGTIVERD